MSREAVTLLDTVCFRCQKNFTISCKLFIMKTNTGKRLYGKFPAFHGLDGIFEMNRDTEL